MKQTKCWILTLVIFYLLGLLLFLRGYFIDRQYLLDRSDGQNFKTQPVILLIIDSFRIDLALSKHFKFFNDMKLNHPDQTLLFLSFAEVPTVTGPRLQAMTSGNFPPLSKLLDNFHASEIVEDNIMFQMKRFNKKTLFSGDDTWIGLYPNIFTEQYPLKSFNIGDMQTVDSFNSEKIFKNIDNGFDLIVSHFLGLDHAGHKNNKVLNNPSLDDKLLQLNYIINSTYNLMSNDTILIVAGDHGMANDGNHGGNSTEETNTVFFAIRKEGQFYPDYMKQITELQDNYISLLASKDQYIRKISQIDVVPTLAKLLGVPIPFSNLGYIINEFFNNEEYCLDNLNQVWKFVQTVHKRQGKFSYSQINKWENQYKNIETCKDALILMNDIQFTARRIWNEYDFPLLNLTLLLQFLIVIFFILVIFGLYYSQNNEDQITTQQITATLKYLITKNKLFTFAIFSILFMIFIQYEIEILITIILILIILYINLILIVKIKRDYVTDRNQYQWDLIEKPDSVKLNNRFQNLLSLSIILFYIYKLIKQGDLLLSIDNKKKEETYLFNEIIQLVIISTIISLFYLFSRIIDTQESNSVYKKLFDGILSVICAIIIYYALKNEQFYLLNNQLQQYLLTPLYQYYLPCLFLHIVLFIYQKEDKLINKIIAQLSLLLIDIFFIYPDQQNLTETAEFIVLHIPKIIYLISFYTVITKDPIYLFFSCLVVSDKFGIAIYSYEILIFILLYFHWKQIIQFCPIAFFGMISLICQITWFIFGNRCTISSIKLDRAFVGVKEFHLWLNPLILTLFLVGPYLSGIVFLKSIESKINKLLELNQIQINNSRNLYKLMFLFNFYIQIQYTQIHSYQNAGGLIDVQFKYIFDCVTYLIISLLMLVY